PTRALASPLRRTLRRPPRPALFPYTTLFRSEIVRVQPRFVEPPARRDHFFAGIVVQPRRPPAVAAVGNDLVTAAAHQEQVFILIDRKSTRLNSSHVKISYAVFCLKKKNEATA